MEMQKKFERLSLTTDIIYLSKFRGVKNHSFFTLTWIEIRDDSNESENHSEVRVKNIALCLE